METQDGRTDKCTTTAAVHGWRRVVRGGGCLRAGGACDAAGCQLRAAAARVSARVKKNNRVEGVR